MPEGKTGVDSLLLIETGRQTKVVPVAKNQLMVATESGKGMKVKVVKEC